MNEVKCPVCAKVGVQACVDSSGRDLKYDHEGRPPFFPPAVEAIFAAPPSPVPAHESPDQ